MKNNPIPFKIDEIICSKFEILGEVTKGEVELETGFAFSANFQNHHVRSTVLYRLIQGNVCVLEHELICSFDVREAEFNQMIVDDQLLLKAEFARYITTINVGAARGEIHARCSLAKSNIARIILPPVNLVEALPNDIVFNIPKDVQ